MARKNGLSGLSMSELQREMARRQRAGGPLQRRRDKAQAKVDALNAQLSELGLGGSVQVAGRAQRGTAREAGGKRPHNEANLVESLQGVLKGKNMSVTEVSEAVQKAGYKTTSPNFRTIVNQTLIKSGAFKRVERGIYTAK